VHLHPRGEEEEGWRGGGGTAIPAGMIRPK